MADFVPLWFPLTHSGEYIPTAPSSLLSSFLQTLQGDIERLLLNHAKTPGLLAPGGEEFNPGP